MIALACFLAACSPQTVGPSPTPTTGPQPPTVSPTGSVHFPAQLVGEREVDLHITSTGITPGVVESVALDSPFFSPSGTVPTSVRLGYGRESILTVPLGRALCPPASGHAIATVEVRAHDGDRVEAVAVVIQGDVLAQINADECRQRTATDAAQPAFVGTPVVTDGTLVATVAMTRGQSTQEATLVELLGNPVFALEPAGLPVTIEGSQARASAAVRITATNCDSTALTAAQDPFAFTATFDVGDERIVVPFTATGPIQEALSEQLDACLAE